jgi:hypothetical protein
MNHLFTVLLDLNGGTYISQVQANCIDNVMKEWIKRKRFKLHNKDLNDGIRNELKIENYPGLLKGLSNAWCFPVLTPSGIFCIFNIIKTSSDDSMPSQI